MAVSADCGISLPAATQIRGAAGLVRRNWRLVKFCNGELMGKKLKLKAIKNNVRQRVCMSLTADVVGEAKVNSLFLF